jgi:hypothetical protein
MTSPSISTARRGALAALLATSALVLGCASHSPADYAAEKPLLDLKTYFNGELVAHGIFTDRDGKTERRVWRLTDLGNGRWEGRADDVVGVAQGVSAGNALNWRYTLALPVGDKVYEVQFDDWMYLMDDKVMLNKAEMSKFGIRLGEVTLSFIKK